MNKIRNSSKLDDNRLLLLSFYINRDETLRFFWSKFLRISALKFFTFRITLLVGDLGTNLLILHFDHFHRHVNWKKFLVFIGIFFYFFERINIPPLLY